MADSMGDGEFWLPSEFLTDDDKENFDSKGLTTGFCFPSEFPYEFSSFGSGSGSSSSVPSSPVESLMGSTETESDDEDFLAGLTRQFALSALEEIKPLNSEKNWGVSGSPQSTLTAVENWSRNGTPNGPSHVSSPTGTPAAGPERDAWDLIFAAAGQVARLKMNGEGPPAGSGPLGPPRSFNPFHPSPPVKTPNHGYYSDQCPNHPLSQFHQVRHNQGMKQQISPNWFYQQNQFQPQRSQKRRIGGGGGGDYNHGGCGVSQEVWPSLQVQLHHQNRNQNQRQAQNRSGMRAVFLGGSGGGLKKECAGTGVFLPRGYGNPPPTETRRKPGCSTALLPARVVQALNKNINGITTHPPPQPHFNGTLTPDYDVMVARRNALLAQQRRILMAEGAINHDIRLPQDWTY